MSKVTWKPAALMAPVPPALVSCGTVEEPNCLTIAWTGNVNTNPPMTYISVRPTRHSYHLIKESGEFVINLTTKELLRTADWCGARSGAKYDKFKEKGLTAEPATIVSAPMIAQSPVSLECKVRSVTPLGTHDMFLADIVAVNVDEKYIDETGKLRLEQCGLVAYAHGSYYAIGKKMGYFGYSVKKHVSRSKLPPKTGRKK